ncbi:NAD(P)H-binding protein [Kineococcus sp. SYSU DK004]|uniref:NAD(P)H-binding protein n=1 Tax=Kineococcus sp. SYSU DK004 TaxID=3383125 RepID=UPI003D7C6DB7
MFVVLAGAHGKIAQHLGRTLAARGDEVVGLVRNPDHAADLEALGVRPVVRDLESASADELAGDLRGADAVVFAAGAGPGSGAGRKDSVDRGAAVLLADAALRAGVAPYLLVSSIGLEAVADGRTPEGVDEVFVAYLRAKLAAEQELLARDGLRLTVLRPGGLTDDAATGRVRLAPSVERGQVPRADVAAVLQELLDRLADGSAGNGEVLELVSGDVPVGQAVEDALTSS